ncbi:uncharacterized protein LOC129598595 [Paramacrobiotus metropolitanus]|uniref:uncharacterized protein LOC129598595 n=1 Tax=Paramacrobiotus metropolitanus TaxID=2943436 RepID=UPI00244590F3|nr:uncharacterized protein LOC129598595 [Paramacrobiotus metropolitanus]
MDSIRETVAVAEQDVVGRSFSAGDVILTCEPWVWAFDRAAYKDYCANCFLEKEGLQTCSRCQLHRYCSKACQVSDWKREHKLECAILREVGGRMAIKRLKDQPAGPFQFCFSATDDLVAKIANKIRLNLTMDLGHRGTLSAADIFALLPLNPSAGGGVESTDESATTLSSDLLTYHYTGGYNAVPIYDFRDDRQYPFAVAIYPQAPIRAMTPVCWDVNVTLNFRGRRLIIVATQDIPNYTGLHDLRHNRMMRDAFSRPLLERRDVFKALHGRLCTCRKCTKEFDAAINPLKCVTPECQEPIPSDRRALAPCPQCGAVNGVQLVKLRRFTDQCDTLWRSGLDEIFRMFEIEKNFKEVKAETFLHPDAHIRYVYSLNRYQDYFDEGRYEEGWKMVQEMVNCLRTIHPKYEVAFAVKAASIGIAVLTVIKEKVLNTPPKQRKRLRSVATAIYPVARSYCKEAEDLHNHVFGPDSAGAALAREWSAELEGLICSLQAALDGDQR